MSEVAPRRTATCEESQVRRGRPSGTPVVPAAGTDPGGENVRLSHDAHKVPTRRPQGAGGMVRVDTWRRRIAKPRGSVA